MKTRVVIASFLTVLVTTAGLRAGSTARQDRIVRPGSDAPYFVAYSVTPPTLKDNRINFVRLYFKFHDDLFDLKGGLLNINFKYQSASGEPLTLFLPEAPEPSARPDRSSGAVLVPSGGRPTFVTYPLLEDVFKRQEGNFELWFGLLAENFGKVTIECWMRDGNGTNGTDTRQATLVRSTTPSGPKQGRNVGQLAYDFTLFDKGNIKRTLSTYRGKVVLIDFCTMWCGPCKNEAAELQGLYLKYKSRGFIILNCLTENYAGNPIRTSDCKTWAQTYGLTFPVLADLFWGVFDPYYGFPSTKRIPDNILIDRTGKIRWKKTGFTPAIQTELEAKIEALLNE